MTTEQQEQASAEQGAAAEAAPFGGDYAVIGKTVIALLQEFSAIVGLEARQTVHSVPKLIAAWLLSLPVLVFAWLGFSTTLGWLAYSLSQQVFAAMATFTVVQVICFAVLQWYLRRTAYWMSFPHTRENIHSFVEGVNRATQGPHQTTAAPPTAGEARAESTAQ
ncbi:hypothetical protein QWI17_21875 [Gilvimarinus sp. SDUM040013]|uniref:Uncharacterized protein n=1 Tax=Gilvimarinus gilvus TaxID=3058038 RepID=A0ABU4RUT0_9GAMM|nr:hypothetical protein [Gilvimarinus sp. SDUM040013]MDO3388511.1 hypothetical protein [Gilvimarinus sp. SDUM040013]MDX6848617.1 hypothetical protein [Gilvimarinus sp. SDUM040013]